MLTDLTYVSSKPTQTLSLSLSLLSDSIWCHMMQLPGIPDADSIHSRHPSTLTSTTPPISHIATSLSERVGRGTTTRASAFRSTDAFMSTLKSMVQRNKESKAMYTTSTSTTNLMMTSPASETSTTTDAALVLTTGTGTESTSSQSHVINRLVDVTNGSALEATTITSGNLDTVSASSTPWDITYTSFPASSYSNCSAHFTNYTQPQPGENGIIESLD